MLLFYLFVVFGGLGVGEGGGEGGHQLDGTPAYHSLLPLLWKKNKGEEGLVKLIT